MENEMVLFESSDGEVNLNVEFDGETVWLTQAQMAVLFQKDRSVITRHIGNIFREGELEKESNVHYLHIANSDKPVAFYCLDVVISVGYRVKSQRGVEFRKWATGVLRRYILDGYAANRRRLEQLKAANLLYFVVKNHSFHDGNKHIAATLFLYFLNMKDALLVNGAKRISDSALVAITIMIAESKPEEKEAMVSLVMSFLSLDAMGELV